MVASDGTPSLSSKFLIQSSRVGICENPLSNFRIERSKFLSETFGRFVGTIGTIIGLENLGMTGWSRLVRGRR